MTSRTLPRRSVRAQRQAQRVDEDPPRQRAASRTPQIALNSRSTVATISIAVTTTIAMPSP